MSEFDVAEEMNKEYDFDLIREMNHQHDQQEQRCHSIDPMTRTISELRNCVQDLDLSSQSRPIQNFDIPDESEGSDGFGIRL
jgi:hypothetical protein